MENKPTSPVSNKAEEALDYPGVANNVADNDKSNAELVKEDVKELNNNPRNCDIDMP